MTYKDLPEIQKAQSLIREYGYTKDTVPVDVKTIIMDQGILLRQVCLPDDISGVLDTRSIAIILINANHSRKRQRFSMAHELGHYFFQNRQGVIHTDRQIFFRSNLAKKGTDEDEKTANRFAAELLMPTTILREKLQIYPDLIDADDDSLIIKLANDFDVSTAALAFKLSGVIRSII
jgi:Zn-dependent peptidase ImmA (M78 family)